MRTRHWPVLREGTPGWTEIWRGVRQEGVLGWDDGTYEGVLLAGDCRGLWAEGSADESERRAVGDKREG